MAKKGRQHKHLDAYTGSNYEVCECGAVRVKDRIGKVPDSWHSCKHCVAAYIITSRLDEKGV